jgi:hypothetical protein
MGSSSYVTGGAEKKWAAAGSLASTSSPAGAAPDETPDETPDDTTAAGGFGGPRFFGLFRDMPAVST